MGEFLEENMRQAANYGSSFTVTDAVEKTGSAEGNEVRRLRHPFNQMHIDVAYDQSSAVGRELVNLWYRANGTYRGFRFTNWLDFSTNNFVSPPTAFDMRLVEAGDTGFTFVLERIYGYDNNLDAGYADSKVARRRIFKPIQDTVKVGLQSLTRSLSVGQTQLDIDYTTGTVELLSNPQTAITWIENGATTVVHCTSHDVQTGELYFSDNPATSQNIGGNVLSSTSTSFELDYDSSGDPDLNLYGVSTCNFIKLLKGDTFTVASRVYSFVSDRASGRLTATAFTDGETVTIGSRTYTFKNTVSTTTDQVLIGSTANETLRNFAAAINDDPANSNNSQYYGTATTPNADVTAYWDSSSFMYVVAKTPGTGANSLATTETLSSGSWLNATLTGGTTPLTLAADEILIGSTMQATLLNLQDALAANPSTIGITFGSGTAANAKIRLHQYNLITPSDKLSLTWVMSWKAVDPGTLGNAVALSVGTSFAPTIPSTAGGTAGTFDLLDYDAGAYTPMFGCHYDIPVRFDSQPSFVYANYSTVKVTAKLIELLKP